MRMRVAIGLAAVVLLGGLGALVYRATGPRLEGGGAVSTSGAGVPGELRGFGSQIWSDDGIRIDDVEVVGAREGDVDVWVNRSSQHLGSFNGDPSPFDLRPARGQWIAGSRDEPVDLVVTFTPKRPGTYRIGEVRVSYGSGLRRRSTTLPFGVCFMALDREPGALPVAPCDASTSEGIFFQL